MSYSSRWAGLLLAFCLVATGVYAAGERAAGEDKASGDASTAPAIHRDVTLGGKPPAESDTLMLSYPADPDTVNPLIANDTTSEAFMRLVYESLAERKNSDPDKWEPSLAESWTFDPATLEYTIHLRKGVMWHPIALPNGTMLPETEMTAKDVKFTFDCILNKNIQAAELRSYYEDAEAKDESQRAKIKVTLTPKDKYTVKIKWLKPYFLADDFTLGAIVIPKHVFSVNENGEPISYDYSSEEFAKGFNQHWANTRMCGTGPMIFKQWIKENRAVLERNPNYWGPPFYFSQMIYRNISNPNTALQELLHNKLDWSVIDEKDLYVQSLDDPNVKDGKVVLKPFTYPSFRYVGYNEKRDFFKDKRVRRAMGHAIPVDKIIHTIFHDLAERTTGPFLPGSSSYDNSLVPLAYDLDKARALLDEAGWTLKQGAAQRSKVVGGREVPAVFELMIRADSPTSENLATTIQDNCRKIGVKVTISQNKWALMLPRLHKRDFDAVLVGWALGWKDDPYQIWDGGQADVPESSNDIDYRNPQVDKLIAKLRVTMDLKEQSGIYRQIHRLIYEDQPYTFLFVDKETAGYDGRIQNVNFYPIRPCIDTREWYSSRPRDLGK